MFLILGSASIWSTQAYAAHRSWDNQENEPPLGLVEPAYSLIDRYESSEKIKVKLNGEAFDNELKPVLVYETVRVPARNLFSTIDMDIEFDQKKLLLTASKSGTVLEFSLKSSIAAANGEESVLPRIPFLKRKSNRMFVPLRYVVESIGGTAKWDDKRKTAYVTFRN